MRRNSSSSRTSSGSFPNNCSTNCCAEIGLPAGSSIRCPFDWIPATLHPPFPKRSESYRRVEVMRKISDDPRTRHRHARARPARAGTLARACSAATGGRYSSSCGRAAQAAPSWLGGPACLLVRSSGRLPAPSRRSSAALSGARQCRRALVIALLAPPAVPLSVAPRRPRPVRLCEPALRR